MFGKNFQTLVSGFVYFNSSPALLECTEAWCHRKQSYHKIISDPEYLHCNVLCVHKVGSRSIPGTITNNRIACNNIPIHRSDCIQHKYPSKSKLNVHLNKLRFT